MANVNVYSKPFLTSNAYSTPHCFCNPRFFVFKRTATKHSQVYLTTSTISPMPFSSQYDALIHRVQYKLRIRLPCIQQNPRVSATERRTKALVYINACCYHSGCVAIELFGVSIAWHNSRTAFCLIFLFGRCNI